MSSNTRKRAVSIDAVQMASAEISHKPPQAPEVEEAVIGAMMLYEDCVYQAVGSLKEKSFYAPKLRLIFTAMIMLFSGIVRKLFAHLLLKELHGIDFFLFSDVDIGLHGLVVEVATFCKWRQKCPDITECTQTGFR